jgi:glutamate-1-semialdehyde 2,1-aminomutase
LAANRVAAVVLEPARHWPPDVGAQNAIGTLARRHGAALVHDEVASGLRVPCLQALGLDPPDLTVLGKGLANGLPLAAVLGRRAVMAPAGPGYLLYSGSTHETVALAAAEVVLTRLGDPAMAAALARADDAIRRALAIGEDCLRVEGHPGMILLRPPPGTVVAPTALRLLLVQELLAQDIYCLGAIYPSGAYDEAALDTLRVAISGAMGAVSRAVLENQVAERLRLEMTNREVVRG